MNRIAIGLVSGALAAGGNMHVLPAIAGSETVAYSFCSLTGCADGSGPQASLIRMKSLLYGTTTFGGTGTACNDGCGTVFSLDPATGAETVLHSFAGGTDGEFPQAALTDVKGTLYGTTGQGGTCGQGTVFSVDPGTGGETVLHSFGCGADGTIPYSNLLHVKGMLYGTTFDGGAYSGGVAYAVDRKTGVEEVVHSFQGSEGYTLFAGLIDFNGTFYGGTVAGGEDGDGTVFSLDPATGAETVVTSFNGSNGSSLYFSLTNVRGTLYGTTARGGSSGEGTVFLLDPKTGAETVLYSFCGQEGCSDGEIPYGTLIERHGTLYGTTYQGGAYSYGTAFSVDIRSGSETVLHSFGSSGSDGASPYAGLIDVKGTLHGTSLAGGAHAGGTVFAILP